MRRLNHNRRFHLETLELRSMMASDFEAALHLETLDSNGNSVSQVQVGETFLLRMSVETSASTPAERMMMNSADITFNPTLAEAQNVIDGVLVPDRGSYPMPGRWAAIPGRWEKIHWFGNANSPGADNSTRRIQWEVAFKAKSGGEVVFQTNPSDMIEPSPEVVHEKRVKHGLVRLQIGDAAMFPPSPWRNPGDPSDVDNNGQINGVDLELIKGALGSNERIVLSSSSVARGQSPFLDVSGDGMIDIADVELVKDQFFPERIVIPPSPFAFLQDPDFQVSLQAINLRTGLAVGADALEGDLLEVAIVGNEQSNKPIFGLFVDSLATLKQSSHFEVLGTFQDHYLLRLVKPGTVAIEHEVTTNGWVLRNIASTLGYGAEGPEVIRQRISELLAGTMQSFDVSANTNRPFAADDSYHYKQFSEQPTAREVAAVIEQVKKMEKALGIRIDKKQGVLENDQQHANAKAILVAQPENGRVKFNEDGSFEFTPSPSFFDSVRLGSRFSYVLITPEGTSEVRTVKINGTTLPLMDIRIRAVDQQGNEVTTASIGQSLTLEVSTFSNNIWNTFDVVPIDYKPNHPLSFRYGLNENVASFDGEPTDFSFFWKDIGELVFENGQYSIKYTPTLFRPTFKRDGDDFVADFKHNFSLADHPNSDHVIFRQRITVAKAGSLDLSIDLPKIELWEAYNQFPGAVHVEVTDVVAFQSAFQNTKLPSDVDQSGEATPLDALIIINSLNLNGSRKLTLLNGEGESSDRMLVDVDGDGFISPLDVLQVINVLNRRGSASGEGEEAQRREAFRPSIDTQLAVDVIAEDIASFRRKKILAR